MTFEASNLGARAFHCQINYHQVSGMFSVVASRSSDQSWWDSVT
ncbi:multicopper oxidase domain-containing protein [Synechococcus sp. MIT S9504]